MTLHFKLEEEDDMANAFTPRVPMLLAFGTHFPIAVGTGLWLHKQRCSLVQRFGIFLVLNCGADLTKQLL